MKYALSLQNTEFIHLILFILRGFFLYHIKRRRMAEWSKAIGLSIESSVCSNPVYEFCTLSFMSSVQLKFINVAAVNCQYYCSNQQKLLLCPANVPSDCNLSTSVRCMQVCSSCQKYKLADVLHLVYISQLFLAVRSTNYNWSTAWIGTRLKTRKITAEIFAV